MEALKPCPHCGSKNIVVSTTKDPFENERFAIECHSCPAEMGWWTDCEDDLEARKAATIAAWNRRADPRPAAQPGVVKEAVRRELADVEASLDDAISYLVDLAGAKPTPMSPQNCRIHIDHARMSARNLAALAAPVSQEPVIKPVDYEKIDIPADIREFGERHKIPEFANATYRNGYVDGYRFAVNEADRDRLAAENERMRKALQGALSDQHDLLHTCREYARAAPDEDIKRIRHIRADRVEERLRATRAALASLEERT